MGIYSFVYSVFKLLRHNPSYIEVMHHARHVRRAVCISCEIPGVSFTRAESRFLFSLGALLFIIIFFSLEIHGIQRGEQNSFHAKQSGGKEVMQEDDILLFLAEKERERREGCCALLAVHNFCA